MGRVQSSRDGRIVAVSACCYICCQTLPLCRLCSLFDKRVGVCSCSVWSRLSTGVIMLLRVCCNNRRYTETPLRDAPVLVAGDGSACCVPGYVYAPLPLFCGYPFRHQWVPQLCMVSIQPTYRVASTPHSLCMTCRSLIVITQQPVSDLQQQLAV